MQFLFRKEIVRLANNTNVHVNRVVRLMEASTGNNCVKTDLLNEAEQFEKELIRTSLDRQENYYNSIPEFETTAVKTAENPIVVDEKSSDNIRMRPEVNGQGDLTSKKTRLNTSRRAVMTEFQKAAKACKKFHKRRVKRNFRVGWLVGPKMSYAVVRASLTI